jgi:hypothetical protein
VAFFHGNPIEKDEEIGGVRAICETAVRSEGSLSRVSEIRAPVTTDFGRGFKFIHV